MAVKLVAPDTIATASNTLKEGVLLSVLKAAKQDFVPGLHDCILEQDTCLLVMDQAPQSLDAYITATVRTCQQMTSTVLSSSKQWHSLRMIASRSIRIQIMQSAWDSKND